MDDSDLQCLQDHDILQAIADAEGMSSQNFAMKFGKKNTWPVTAMAGQIALRKKLARKLPHWQSQPIILEGEALQQSSSARTAQHKATLYQAEIVGDLCAGLGVDILAAGKSVKKIHYNDRSSLRCDLFKWNAEVQQQQVQIHNHDAAEFLQSMPDGYFDMLYCDPSRRSHDKRVVSLHACDPNILELADLCRVKSRQLLLKMSPSITEASLQETFPGLQRFMYLSLDSERKESLALIDLHQQYDQVQVEAHCLQRDGTQRQYVYDAGSAITCLHLHQAAEYIYEPDPALLAAGILSALCTEYDMSVVSTNHPQLDKAHSVLLTHDQRVADFPGQTYRVLASMPFNRKQLRRYISQAKIERMQIMRRNCNLEVAVLRRLLKVKDGGQDIGLCIGTDEKNVIFYHLQHVE
ncbi:MAG: hypothetical protein HRU15_06900 [Planctomycetes bacterium]|nr:hypothetical protein [Planctomycetota bacterium]